jgi:methylmalonyl-CoA mutase
MSASMTAAAKDDLPLAAEFPAASREQWLALVDKALKGAPFEKKLVHTTYDGLRIDPLYQRRSDAMPLAGRAAAAAGPIPWQIMARVDHPDPAIANRLLLDDLEGGATGAVLVAPGSIGAYGFGADLSAAGLARILDGVFIEGIAIEFDLTTEAKDAPAHLAAILKTQGIAPDKADIRFAYDPLGIRAASGHSVATWAQIAPLLARMVGGFSTQGFRGPFIAADGRSVHAAGGSEAQELAFALGNAVTYLRALEASGIALDAARKMISFRLAADADQFLTMAKFRAIRKLWARVEEACGLKPAPVFISAETAWRMMTTRDTYVNMLRTTIAAFAAGLGGANAITVLPFTNALGLPDTFARRVARNTQLILEEESNLAKVSDPAAGSGGIEALTDELCRAAWVLFQEIEAAGGADEALSRGVIQNKVAETRAAREKAIATRKDPLTGLSEFPHLKENHVTVLDVARVVIAPSSTQPLTFPALTPMRLSEPFEALRDASDPALKKTGSRPKIFLANLGNPVDFIARSMFARNFFEAGGIEAVEFSSSPLPVGERSTAQRSGEGEQHSAGHHNPSPGPSPAAPDRPLPMGEVKNNFDSLASAFKQSGAKLACLCSSDEVYADQAEAAAKALAAAGAAHIYLAGRPGKNEADIAAAGVKTFIYAGCDALRTLCIAHDILGLR